jgi:hypothetical protein
VRVVPGAVRVSHTRAQGSHNPVKEPHIQVGYTVADTAAGTAPGVQLLDIRLEGGIHRHVLRASALLSEMRESLGLG